ncbi:MAG: sulfite exporter TauE/SafE family protein [Deltaproteobacteria bacterium]|nr:sulfite exporter TauE/SafE family protein [Deltaproteobacteria bacterium]
MSDALWLVPLGVLVGAFGTLIGAGGGFLLVPFLLLWRPDTSPEAVTAISLAVVFTNALSGSFAYAKKRRIDYRSAVLFAVAGIPGAMLGAWVVGFIPAAVFRPVFGGALLAGTAYLIARAGAPITEVPTGAVGFHRELTDREGHTYRWSYPLPLGMAISTGVGVISSLLGLGGGIIHVPVMVRLLRFPVHVATATSHLTLGVITLTAVLVHAVLGNFDGALHPTLELAIGVVIGAQLGAKLSDRVGGVWIIRALAGALGIVGLRLLVVG